MNEHQWPEVISRLTQFFLSLPPHTDGSMNLCVCVCELCARDSGIPLRGEMKRWLRRCIDLKDYCHTDYKTRDWDAVALLKAPSKLWDSRFWFFLTVVIWIHYCLWKCGPAFSTEVSNPVCVTNLQCFYNVLITCWISKLFSGIKKMTLLSHLDAVCRQSA